MESSLFANLCYTNTVENKNDRQSLNLDLGFENAATNYNSDKNESSSHDDTSESKPESVQTFDDIVAEITKKQSKKLTKSGLL